jgi:hypothetical protein
LCLHDPGIAVVWLKGWYNSVSLSPRGFWRMPSDACVELWLDDLEAMYRKLKDGREAD